MPKKIRVTAVTFDGNNGVVYQRLHLPWRHLDPEKYEFKFVTLGEHRHVDFFYSDVIVMCHTCSPLSLEIAEKARFHYRIPVISDMDDFNCEVPVDHPEYARFKGHKVPQICQASTHLTYSTKYLASRLGHLNSNYTVIPNTIDKKTYEMVRPMHKPYKNCFIAGWTGSQSHRSDQLYTFVPGLMQFLSEYHDAKAYFHVLCPDILPKKFGSQIIYEPHVCDYMDYPGVSAAYPFSVCMVGLQDNSFNHAKSDLKLLEMSPHEIPLIASPRTDFMQHKEREFMLYAEDESLFHKNWYEQLKFAYEHPEVTAKMAERAREYVMKERLSTVAAAQWDELFNKVVGV